MEALRVYLGQDGAKMNGARGSDEVRDGGTEPDLFALIAMPRWFVEYRAVDRVSRPESSCPGTSSGTASWARIRPQPAYGGSESR